MAELQGYSPALAELPMIVAANKIDLDTDKKECKRFMEAMKGKDQRIFPVSAATHQGLRELMRCAAELLDKLPVAEPEPETFDETQLTENLSYSIRRTAESLYEVEGTLVDHILRHIYLQDQNSMRYFSDQLKKQGIIDGLRAKGVKDGDTVILGDVEFDFVE